VIVRRLLVAVLALLLAGLVGRVAAVRALAQPDPMRAQAVWPAHPRVRIEAGLVAIAQAARHGRTVDPATMAGIFEASARAPLAADPFLVRGVQAQLAGDLGLAERAFRAARDREARSLPARYFLADLYLRNGDADRGLAEVAVLARLAPNGVDKLAPYVATYASNRANWPQVRAMFAREPPLENASLRALAAKPDNADAVLALASRGRRTAASSWLPVLVATLTDAGQYAKARRIWSQVANARGAGGATIFDSHFTDAGPPPPFNWTLTSSTVGLAERQAGRGLHIIYYGNEDGVLASQLLVLPPGRYRLGTDAPGLPAAAASLRWTLYCARGNGAIASAPLDKAASGGMRFVVPASCPAQRLELAGTAAELTQSSDLVIRSLALSRDQSGG
jgi:hypothetical protein